MNTLTNGLLKRALSILLVTIMVFSLGIVGITSTSAAEVEMAETGWGYVNGVFYFDNSTSDWSAVQLIIGRDSEYWEGSYKHEEGSQGYKMTNIPNTELWYVQISDFKYASAICFTNVGEDWAWSSSGVNDQITYLSTTGYKYSYEYNINEEFNNNRFFKADSTSNPTSLSYTYYGSTDDMNQITQKAIVRDVTSGTSVTSNSVGTVTVSGIYISGVGQGNTATASSKLNSTSQASVDIVRSSKVTLTATPADGYEFVGWTTSNTATTTTTNKSKSIYYYSTTDAKTYYALFEKSLSLTAGEMTINPSGDVNAGTELTLSTKATLTGGTDDITYTLYDNDVQLATQTIAYNTAVSFTTTPSTSGTHTYKITASYTGVSDVSVSKTVTVNDLSNGLSVVTEYADGITVGDGDALTVNAGADFTINYTASHTDDDVTYAYAVNDVNADRTTVDGDTWSYTGKAGDTVGNTETVTMYVWAIKNGVESETYTTVTTTYTVYKLVPTVSVEAPESVYYNEKYNVTVTTNVDGNKDYTVTYGVYWYDSTDYDGDDVYYELYTNKGGVEDGTFEGFWYDCSSAGSTSTLYYGAVITNTVTGEVTTFADYENQSFSVAIKDYSITATLTGNTNAGLGDDVTLTANATLNAPADVVSSAQLTYSFYNADGDALLQQGDSNTYTYTTEATDSDKTVSIYVVVSCSIEDESDHCQQDGSTVHDYSAQAAHSFTVTGDNAEYTVKVLFKAPVNWAYKPAMTIKVTDSDSAEKTVEVTEDTHAWIAEYNSDQFYQFYKWYSYEFTVIGSDTINLNVAAGRDTFYKGNYEFSVATESDFEDDNGTRLYYFALDNLNNPTDTKFTNLSLSEYKDITISATNMITVEEKEVASLVSSGTTFTSAVYGDANCDGRVNIKDATYVQKSLANMVEADELSTIVSDFNQDGKVTIKDATAIQKQLAGL